MADTPRICIGIDVGGTFTDCVMTNGTNTWRGKAPTTNGEIGRGVLAAAEITAQRSGRTLDALLPSVSRFGLGTTAVTNVLSSRTGRRVGLLATNGFEEMLPLAQGMRVVDEDGWLSRPSVVDRRSIAGIDERMDLHGEVVRALDPDQVTAAVRHLVEDEGIEALAVSFLWSFVNPLHEVESVALASALYPDLPIISGAALHPAIREYERTTYAVLNAYVSGAFSGIEELDEQLHRRGLRTPLLLVHSGGGSMTIGEARRQPLGLALSGPAAGVAAGAAIGEAMGAAHIVTADMGGTSFDVSVIINGEPARRTRGSIMGVWTALSLIDVESIGDGGGSFGWIDARGMLRVGPRSAGAVPGPACYGRGGDQATVTDALVVLGFIDPARFLGGDFELDADAAYAACARLGASLDLEAQETAWGIRQLALTGMIKAVRGRLASQGLDPRHYALLSYGGGGSLFTPEIAQAIGAPRVLIPELASVFSAFGAATTNVRRERLRSVMRMLPVDPAILAQMMTEMEVDIHADLAADGVPPIDHSVSFEADMRFGKQVFELQMPIATGPFTEASASQLLASFMEEYGKRYGQGSIVLRTPVELVALRAIGIGSTHRAAVGAAAREPVEPGTLATPVGRRRLHLDRAGDELVEVDVYDWTSLHPGHQLKGAALVDSLDTTIWVPSGCSGSINHHGTMIMEVAM